MWNQTSTRFSQIVGEQSTSAVTIAGALSGLGSSRVSDCDLPELRIEGGRPECDARLAGNVVPTSIWSARHDGSIAFVDDLERNTADVQDDPNGGGWFDTIHPDDRQRTLASWSSALRTGRPFHDVHRARERSGRYERFLVDGVAIRDDEGRTVCWIGAKTAIGEPEVDCVEPRRGHAVFAGSGRLDRASDSSRHSLDQARQRSALSAQPIYVGPKTNAGRRIDDPLLTADEAPRSQQSPEPNSAIGKNFLEAVSAAADAALTDSPKCLDPKLLRDPRVKGLLEDLSGARGIPAELARVYSHSLCVAALARIGGSRLIARTCGQRRPIAPLPKWRLARVNQYIDAHMEEPIRLTNLAKAAGLTRMHFAAQFRASVGMCPHEYLLRQRITRAQALLQDPGQRLVDVALSVGFQAQPHFTTVFRRYVGESPHRWRLSQSANSDANLRDLGQGQSSRC